MWADEDHTTAYTVQVLSFHHMKACSYKCVIFAPPPLRVRVRACIELEIYI